MNRVHCSGGQANIAFENEEPLRECTAVIHSGPKREVVAKATNGSPQGESIFLNHETPNCRELLVGRAWSTLRREVELANDLEFVLASVMPGLISPSCSTAPRHCGYFAAQDRPGDSGQVSYILEQLGRRFICSDHIRRTPSKAQLGRVTLS